MICISDVSLVTFYYDSLTVHNAYVFVVVCMHKTSAFFIPFPPLPFCMSPSLDPILFSLSIYKMQIFHFCTILQFLKFKLLQNFLNQCLIYTINLNVKYICLLHGNIHINTKLYAQE